MTDTSGHEEATTEVGRRAYLRLPGGYFDMTDEEQREWIGAWGGQVAPSAEGRRAAAERLKALQEGLSASHGDDGATPPGGGDDV